MDRTEFLLFDEIPVIILDNFYNAVQLKQIWEELNFFIYTQKLKPPLETGSATQGGELLKENSGLWLDHVFRDQRELSNILTINRKIFFDDCKIFRDSPSWFYKHFKPARDTTLLSYYENGGYYKPHHDNATVTVLNWFFKEPKRFEGGNLVFDVDERTHEIEVKNNRLVIFPSCINHSVIPVTLEEEYQNQRFGRCCVTQFLSQNHNHMS